MGGTVCWGRQGLLEFVSHTRSVLVPALKEELQTHQQGKQDRVTITLSLGRGRPRAGVQGKMGKCSQLGSLVPKGFLEEVVFELGLNKLGD